MQAPFALSSRSHQLLSLMAPALFKAAFRRQCYCDALVRVTAQRVSSSFFIVAMATNKARLASLATCNTVCANIPSAHTFLMSNACDMHHFSAAQIDHGSLTLRHAPQEQGARLGRLQDKQHTEPTSVCARNFLWHWSGLCAGTRALRYIPSRPHVAALSYPLGRLHLPLLHPLCCAMAWPVTAQDLSCQVQGLQQGETGLGVVWGSGLGLC